MGTTDDTIDADLFRQFYEDNEYWEKTFGKDHCVDDSSIELYDDDGNWIATGALDREELGVIVNQEDWDFVCDTDQAFDQWLEDKGLSEWVTRKIRVDKDQADRLISAINNIDGVEVLDD